MVLETLPISRLRPSMSRVIASHGLRYHAHFYAALRTNDSCSFASVSISVDGNNCWCIGNERLLNLTGIDTIVFRTRDQQQRLRIVPHTEAAGVKVQFKESVELHCATLGAPKFGSSNTYYNPQLY
jgi:hypothetical protein